MLYVCILCNQILHCIICRLFTCSETFLHMTSNHLTSNCMWWISGDQTHFKWVHVEVHQSSHATGIDVVYVYTGPTHMHMYSCMRITDIHGKKLICTCLCPWFPTLQTKSARCTRQGPGSKPAPPRGGLDSMLGKLLESNWLICRFVYPRIEQRSSKFLPFTVAVSRQFPKVLLVSFKNEWVKYHSLPCSAKAAAARHGCSSGSQSFRNSFPEVNEEEATLSSPNIAPSTCWLEDDCFLLEWMSFWGPC